MPANRKRPNAASDTESTPNARRRRRQSEEPDSSAPNSDDDGPSASNSTDAMVKKMVRFAIASEYSRLPIRRNDISTKVLGEQGSRQFKLVFDQAQRELKQRFGMEMTELPAREKVTITQRRAAQKTEKPSSANKSWIVTSTLPLPYRSSDILIPTKAPSLYTESTYTGLYSFIIALIVLNGGSLAEQKLDRYLTRTNADVATPVDRTDRLLQRLCKEGYIIKTREMDGGEEVIEYVLGPRGKIEVGTGGVAGLVRTVYGKNQGDHESLTQLQREDLEDFEAKLGRSLGIEPAAVRANGVDGASNVDGDARVNGNGDTPRSSGPRRSSRRGATPEEGEDSDSEEYDEEE
ncbi:MAGE protein [Penicillium cf. griseofulvum]|uniref:MAGE protein n=1 Tax=Penicillium cf. griseofulvum TaxID=2972120 RepID=A0A9W9IV74_9EURO|nr:MAGE protein [Penicillium cf. griseofulvum]KAJ5430418.1 MAGE protein [Penicillium cf. griseofulvum]KAJ5435812.1 MAGE protein [Penicillium cf. griseofulvum]